MQTLGKKIARLAKLNILNYRDYLDLYFGVFERGLLEIHLKSGLIFTLRANANSVVGDAHIFAEVILDDCYNLRELNVPSQSQFIIDIGAHIGLVTCYMAKMYPQKKVIAIEPDKVSYDLLLKNISLNELANIKVYNSAVCSAPNAFYFLNKLNSGGGKTRLLNERNTGVLVEPVSLKKVTIFNKIDRIGFLKVDCEGCEESLLSELEANDFLIDSLAIEIESHIALSKWTRFLDGRSFDILSSKTSAPEGDFFILKGVSRLGEL